MADKLRVKAQHLLPGDVLVPTDRTVHRIWVGVRTPPGKITVELLSASGYLQTYFWGRNTTVTILRPAPAAPLPGQP